ncbi:MAG TPA: DUF6351 family protein [Kineosporiaceae bacterium]|nr:DUF6351 family protein [Kineosporiaceae bacterium]
MQFQTVFVRRYRGLLILLLGLALVVPLSASAQASPAHHAALALRVLSGRADTVSGGDALVEVVGGSAGTVVRLNGRDVSRQFAVRADGRFVGLVTGLRVGRNEMRARARHRIDARLALTNHPLGGPVFSGPQVQPWDCNLHPAQTGLGLPVDAQCNTPTVISYRYLPTGGGGFQPYDPANPPSDVARTTTDAGRTVPYVVRLETGVQDRGIYRVAVLFDPAQGWTPFAPQSGWNRKVVWPFGGGSAPHHVSELPVDVLDDTLLSRGYLVASSGLNVHGANANEVVSAEAVTMLKEHLIETYGEIRYTIGAGCSGGAIQQYVIADAYPGLLDGILPNCSFPDTWSTAVEVQDCGLLVRYFAATTGWTPAQQAAVEGTKDPSVCQYWNQTFVPVGTPSRASNCGFPTGDPRVYDAVTNPGGVRCVAQDYEVAIWGRRPARLWTPAEKAAGYGFARSVSDNVGVLYGLDALRAGIISGAQFADLNARIGGFDQDGVWQAQRTAADPGAVRIAYRTGQVTEGQRLDNVPIIDLRGSANSLDIHSDYHSWEMRARLDASNGQHANQVIWTWRSSGNFAGITPPPDVALQALTTMDTWLAAIKADRRPIRPAAKVIAHKPRSAVDTCWPASTPSSGGAEVIDPEYAGTCGSAFPHYGDARMAAGDRLSGLALKCALTPLRRSELPQLTEAQFAAVRTAAPRGQCDFSARPVGYRRSLPWLSFTGGPGGAA